MGTTDGWVVSLSSSSSSKNGKRSTWETTNDLAGGDLDG